MRVGRAAGAVFTLASLHAQVSAKTEAVPACADDATPILGALDPFRAPAPKAAELNADGKVPYRQGKWDEARAKYRAALVADPEFLAPRLNIACSFVRQERFAEATAEVVALIDRAYVPWAREVIDAADLGALRVGSQEIQRAMSSDAVRWGAAVSAGLLFVARQGKPLRVPDGPGVFLINPHQEIWSYVPGTGRYLQVTSEEGHVVAMAPTSDGRRVLYVTAEKLVRGARPDDVALRGVAVRELTFATMSLGPRVPVAGDVRRLAIHSPTPAIAIGDDVFFLSPEGALEPAEIHGSLGSPAVTLTGRGVEPARERRFGGRYVARRATGPEGAPSLDVGPLGGTLKLINAGAGGGLNGLPLP